MGIATQKDHLRARLVIEDAAVRLDRFLRAAVELMQVLARALGCRSLQEFEVTDLPTFKRDMADLAGIAYGGISR